MSVSLREVNLDPLLIAEMYRQPLIQRGNHLADASLVEDIKVPSLGNNKKRWLLLINNPAEAYLNEEVFSMLLKLLNACKLTLDDIALVNLAHTNDIEFHILKQKFSPVKVILFGDVLNELTKSYHKNKSWAENDIYFLHTDQLKDMSKDQQLKIPFWNALKDFLTV